MSQKLNHHWVPRYHLRLFSRHARCIHLASRDGEWLVERASIKSQCARHKFYGDERVEDWLHDLESRHAAALKAVIAVAAFGSEEALKTREMALLRQALLLQWARTPRTAKFLSDAIERPILHTYREYLGTLPPSRERIRVMRAIDEGRASMSGSEASGVRHALWFASRAFPLISDLRLLILGNDTGVPFVMGDTPCLCSNHYLRNVQGFGVLGLSQRGLMMYMPIDTQTAVLLIDKAVYRAPRFERDCVSIGDLQDVAVLNALEVCAAQECLYFADWADRTYVRNLVDEHPARAGARLAGFEVLGLASEESAGGTEIEALHTYQEQLPVTVDLSFIRTQALSPRVNPSSPRRPGINRILARELGVGRQGGGLGIDELVRQVESELVSAP